MANVIDKRYNPTNEVMKYNFFIELEQGKGGRDQKTVRGVGEKLIKVLDNIL
jgi:hypothetical protein